MSTDRRTVKNITVFREYRTFCYEVIGICPLTQVSRHAQWARSCNHLDISTSHSFLCNACRPGAQNDTRKAPTKQTKALTVKGLLGHEKNETAELNGDSALPDRVSP